MLSSDMAQLKLLEDRKKQADNKINELRKKKMSFISLNSLIDIKINQLQIESRNLGEEIKKFKEEAEVEKSADEKISLINQKYNSNVEKEEKYTEIVKNLKEMNKDVETRHGKAVLNRKIKHYEKKVERLKGRNVFIGKVQRTIKYPKFRIQELKKERLYRAEGKVLYNESQIKDNEKLKEAVVDGSLFSSFKKSYYDQKIEHYRRQLSYSQDKLARMKNKENKVTVKGGRVMPLKKKIKEKINSINTPEPIPAVGHVM